MLRSGLPDVPLPRPALRVHPGDPQAIRVSRRVDRVQPYAEVLRRDHHLQEVLEEQGDLSDLRSPVQSHDYRWPWLTLDLSLRSLPAGHVGAQTMELPGKFQHSDHRGFTEASSPPHVCHRQSLAERLEEVLRHQAA